MLNTSWYSGESCRTERWTEAGTTTVCKKAGTDELADPLAPEVTGMGPVPLPSTNPFFSLFNFSIGGFGATARSAQESLLWGPGPYVGPGSKPG